MKKVSSWLVLLVFTFLGVFSVIPENAEATRVGMGDENCYWLDSSFKSSREDCNYSQQKVDNAVKQFKKNRTNKNRQKAESQSFKKTTPNVVETTENVLVNEQQPNNSWCPQNEEPISDGWNNECDGTGIPVKKMDGTGPRGQGKLCNGRGRN